MKPNIERNNELVQKRLSDPKKWSFGKLGSHYNIDKTTAEDIFNRDILKYADEKMIAIYKGLLEKGTDEGSYPQVDI